MNNTNILAKAADFVVKQIEKDGKADACGAVG
jgi:hypothetical protein